MKQLFIFTKPPYGGDSGKESLDMALAFATFDQTTSLLLLDSGVFQLLAEQHPKLVRQKEYTRLFNGLDLYDIESVFVAESALKQYGLTVNELVGEPVALSDSAIQTLLADYERVTCL